MMNTQHRIINGDCRAMHELPAQSVQLIITSPPYWQLKHYGAEDEIGYHDTYETYINHLNLVWQECYRVLHDGCRLCINIGDQFARATYYGRYKVIPIRTEIIRCCETLGFDYMGAVIWQKQTSMNTSGGATIMGSFPYPRNGIVKLDYEFILIFKKNGKAPKVSDAQKKASAMTKEEWNTYFAGHWNFGGARQEKHLAMFPEELPKRLIKMFSFVGETVLDPFMGSGTTSLAALNLDRHSFGYEINPDFIPIIREKLNAHQPNSNPDSFLFEKQILKTDPDWEQEIAKLPYRFKDPHQLDKQTDPKAKRYGSKIGHDANAPREEYFSVKEIISPELIQLNNDSIIRLIGIQTEPAMLESAIAFLRQKTKGQKVYLKFDELKLDSNGITYAYLYLENKTFLNAHLIKQGLSRVDTQAQFKHKARFLKYLNDSPK